MIGLFFTFAPHAGKGVTIEPSTFISFHDNNYGVREETKDNLNI
jgi:hypothetical protein